MRLANDIIIIIICVAQLSPQQLSANTTPSLLFWHQIMVSFTEPDLFLLNHHTTLFLVA
jgi:hypothetical protein